MGDYIMRNGVMWLRVSSEIGNLGSSLEAVYFRLLPGSAHNREELP